MLLICETNMYVCWLLLFPWPTHEEQYKGIHVHTKTQTRKHAHTYTHACGWCSFIPGGTGVFWDGAECCQGKAVFAAICSVLFCAVLNMTHIKRFWFVLSLFERSCSLISLNYWENGAHFCLGEYLGPFTDLINYSVYIYSTFQLCQR